MPGNSIPPNYDSLVGSLSWHGTQPQRGADAALAARSMIIIDGMIRTSPLFQREVRNADPNGLYDSLAGRFLAWAMDEEPGCFRQSATAQGA